MSADPEKPKKQDSWQSSPNAGQVLLILAAVGAVVILLAGFFD